MARNLQVIKAGKVYNNIQKVIEPRVRPYRVRNYYHLCECVLCGKIKEFIDISLSRKRLTCECLILKKRRLRTEEAIIRRRKKKEEEAVLREEREQEERELNAVIKRLSKCVRHYTPNIKQVCLLEGTIINNKEVISYKSAKEKGLMYWFSGIPCKNNHLANRTVTGTQCVVCMKERSNSRDRALVKEKAREWYKANREVRIEKAKEYQKDNTAKTNARNAKRRGKRVQATPDWLTEDHLLEIEDLYLLSVTLKEETGVAHHVDHIVPLQGELVSGLHVPWNLQVITARENMEKSNSFDIG